MKNKESKQEHDKIYVPDPVKHLLQWLVVSALSFLYWMGVLLLLSLILLNVWHVTFQELLQISFALTCVTAVAYGGVLAYRRSREKHSS